jgi:hypothetical protein
MHRLLALLIFLATAVHAQTHEVGARYWLSSGTRVSSHNAQGVDPTFGNPTSTLTYNTLTGHAVELYGRRNSPARWFTRGNVGLGLLRSGWFEDEDFFLGQRKFSDTFSPVKGHSIAYATLDAGRDVWVFGEGRTVIGLFVGYNYWSERLDAYGAAYNVPPGTRPISESTRVITNETTWHSLRMGIAASARLTARTRLTIDAALVPYSAVRDEDSHYLRTSSDDLGPVPNIIMEGHGNGYQLDIELRHAIQETWELGAGFRYWRLRATRGERLAAGTSVPMTELESTRSGLLLSLTRRW